MRPFWYRPAVLLWIVLLFPALALAPFAVFVYDVPDPGRAGFLFAVLWATMPVTIAICIVGMLASGRREAFTVTRLFAIAPLVQLVTALVIGLYFAD